MRKHHARDTGFGRLKLALAAAVGTALAGLTAPIAATQQAIPQDPSRLLVVDCLLPGQVRKLGGQMTYLAPGRPIKTVAVDCEIRGGEYVAYDRANYATSLAVWMPQAEQGDPQAQVYVGEIFEKGLGREPDLVAAAAWYEKAAAQKFARGQMNLAYLYEQGLGVAKDTLKAAFEAAKNPAKIEVYSSLHGWCMSDMPVAAGAPPIYNQADAEKAWGELLALYKAALA